jgi:hypothetical protein
MTAEVESIFMSVAVLVNVTPLPAVRDFIAIGADAALTRLVPAPALVRVI